MEHLQYPAGRFQYPKKIQLVDLDRWLTEIEQLPVQFRTQVESMTSAQIETPYREAGWTARQVIHHVPDSHLNAYCRYKLSLTEDSPVIKPYLEDRWAELPDTPLAPIEIALDLLDILHRRWMILLKAMQPEDFQKTYIHPEYGRSYSLGAVTALYAWHGQHHLGHLKLISS